MPLFSKPIEFKSPAAVSTILGAGLPSLPRRVTVLVTRAPTLSILALTVGQEQITTSLQWEMEHLQPNGSYQEI